MVGDHGSSYYAEKAEDFLLADDPALFSDEFSDPEDWGLLDQQLADHNDESLPDFLKCVVLMYAPRTNS